MSIRSGVSLTHTDTGLTRTRDRRHGIAPREGHLYAVLVQGMYPASGSYVKRGTGSAALITIMNQDRRILVVEDDKDILDVLTITLEAEGYQVSLATDGLEALNQVKRQAPDAILLDLMLPFMDGWQVIKALQADLTTSRIPIIVLSAAYDVAKDPALGSLVVVAKPFDVGMLLILLEDALLDQASLAQT